MSLLKPNGRDNTSIGLLNIGNALTQGAMAARQRAEADKKQQEALQRQIDQQNTENGFKRQQIGIAQQGQDLDTRKAFDSLALKFQTDIQNGADPAAARAALRNAAPAYDISPDMAESYILSGDSGQAPQQPTPAIGPQLPSLAPGALGPPPIQGRQIAPPQNIGQPNAIQGRQIQPYDNDPQYQGYEREIADTKAYMQSHPGATNRLPAYLTQLGSLMDKESDYLTKRYGPESDKVTQGATKAYNDQLAIIAGQPESQRPDMIRKLNLQYPGVPGQTLPPGELIGQPQFTNAGGTGGFDLLAPPLLPDMKTQSGLDTSKATRAAILARTAQIPKDYQLKQDSLTEQVTHDRNTEANTASGITARGTKAPSRIAGFASAAQVDTEISRLQKENFDNSQVNQGVRGTPAVYAAHPGWDKNADLSPRGADPAVEAQYQDNLKRIDRLKEIRAQFDNPSTSSTSIGSGDLSTDPAHGGNYGTMITTSAAKYKVDPIALQAIIKQESGGNVNAYGRNHNGTTDHGIMQINSATKNPASYNWRDPAENIEAGAAEFATKLAAAHGDYKEAFRRYNGSGPAARAYAEKVYSDYMALKGGRQTAKAFNPANLKTMSTADLLKRLASKVH